MKGQLVIKVLLVLTLILGLQLWGHSQKAKTNIKGKITKPRKEIANADKETKHTCVSDPKISPDFYAPIRYVIVYNSIFNEGRRIAILMKSEQLNEENLICIFGKIASAFPTPNDLMIRVHTDLATIETPEEKEMGFASHDPRFSHTYEKYKSAFYLRQESGEVFFHYTVDVLPVYHRKTVVLVDKKRSVFGKGGH